MFYHATLADHEVSIREHGLRPSIGRFMRNCHPESVVPVVCFSDSVCMATYRAFQFHVNAKLQRPGGGYMIRIDDIAEYGLLCTVEKYDAILQHDGSDAHPEGPEHPSQEDSLEGDYYSLVSVPVTRFIKGDELYECIVNNAATINKGQRQRGSTSKHVP